MTPLPMSKSMIDILDRQAVRDFGDLAKDMFHDTREESTEQERDTTPEEADASEPSTYANVPEQRVTRSMTQEAGGIEEYNIRSSFQ